MWAIVGMQLIAPTIQIVNFGIGDAIGDSADIFSKEWMMVAIVCVCRGKAEDNVASAYFEVLDDAALWEEAECFRSGRCPAGHDLSLVSVSD
jgi:hypothetical protein